MRIQGITIPDNKRLEIGLTALYGVGRTRARAVLAAAGVDFAKKPTDVSADDENKIREALEEYTIEGDLKREMSANIKRLKDISSYRGNRHSRSLPMRSRTKTNARTVPSGISARHRSRATMGSGRTKVSKT